MELRNDPEKEVGVLFSGARCLFVFRSVHQVMKAEKVLKARGYRVDLIPMPREISSDCGVAVELPFEVYEGAAIFLNENRVPFLVSYAKRDGRYERVERE